MSEPNNEQIVENDLAQTLNVTDGNAAYYAAAKNLVANKGILAYLLKYTMEEFKDILLEEVPQYIEGEPKISEDTEIELLESHVEENGRLSGSSRIKGSPAEDKSIREGRTFYDIYFVAHVPQSRDPVHVIVNFEVQNSGTPGNPITKRGEHYASQMISAQMGTVFKGTHYEKLQKVVSMWICVGAAEDSASSINEYLVQENCLHGDYIDDPVNYDLQRVIVIRLGADGEKNDNPMVRLLSKLFSETLSKAEKQEMLANEFNIAVTEAISQKMDTMCNLSAGIFNQGVLHGMLIAKREIAFKLHDEHGFSLEHIASTVSESLATVQQWFAERPPAANLL